jgi:hypothetical protein
MEFNAEEKTFLSAEKMREYTYNACKEKIITTIESCVLYGRTRLNIVDWPKDIVLSLIDELRDAGYMAGHTEFKHLTITWSER